MAIEKNGTEVIKRDLRYTFSNTELLEIGKRLAEGARRLGELDKEKKRITSDYTARMNAVESEVNILSAAILSGYDIRPIECRANLHCPNAGEKTIVRLDTFETVGVEQMTGDEMQTMPKTEAEAKASVVAAAVKTSATEFPTEAKGAAGRLSRIADRQDRDRPGHADGLVEGGHRQGTGGEPHAFVVCAARGPEKRTAAGAVRPTAAREEGGMNTTTPTPMPRPGAMGSPPRRRFTGAWAMDTGRRRG